MSGDELRKAMSLALGNDDVRKLREFLVTEGHTLQVGMATATRMRGRVWDLIAVKIPFKVGRLVVLIKQGNVEETLAETELGLYIVKSGVVEFLTKEELIAAFNSAAMHAGILSAPCESCQTNSDCGPLRYCARTCLSWDANCLLWCAGTACLYEVLHCMAGDPLACLFVPLICLGCTGACCTQYQHCCSDLPAP